jgi:hypothetical protein
MASQKRFNFSRAGGLFNRKTLRRELTKVVFEPTDRQLRVAKNWAEQVRHPNFDKARETAVRGEFIQAVLVTLLGYAPYRAGETYTIATEEALGRGAVDTALGTFSGSERIILAPVELKGPKTRDLDAIMPGRNKSPVQQAWNMPSTRRAPNGCLSQIARKSGSTPSAMGASNMRRGIFRLSTTRRSMSGHGSLSAHKISSLAAPPPCSTKARMSKRTLPTSFMSITRRHATRAAAVSVDQHHMRNECCNVGSIGVHVIPRRRRTRSTVASTIVGNDAKAFLEEEQQLVIPLVCRERPPMVKNDRLPSTPIFEKDFGPIVCFDFTYDRSPNCGETGAALSLV